MKLTSKAMNDLLVLAELPAIAWPGDDGWAYWADVMEEIDQALVDQKGVLGK